MIRTLVAAASMMALTEAQVVEMVLRRLKPETNVTDFEAARAGIVEKLAGYYGPKLNAFREFDAILDYKTFGQPEPRVFIGMNEYPAAENFNEIAGALQQLPEFGDFFSMFTPEAFMLLAPSDPATPLAQLANAKGNLFEFSYRNLSLYENFDAAAYEAARDAFSQELLKIDGVVGVQQWVNTYDPNTVLATTVYENAEKQAAMAAGGFFGSDVFANFVGVYPFHLGYLTTDISVEQKNPNPAEESSSTGGDDTANESDESGAFQVAPLLAFAGPLLALLL